MPRLRIPAIAGSSGVAPPEIRAETNSRRAGVAARRLPPSSPPVRAEKKERSSTARTVWGPHGVKFVRPQSCDAGYRGAPSYSLFC